MFITQKVGKKQTNVRETNQVLFWGIKRKTPTMLNQKDLYLYLTLQNVSMIPEDHNLVQLLWLVIP